MAAFSSADTGWLTYALLRQTDDLRPLIRPVGACGVGWNPREWLNSARGL